MAKWVYTFGDGKAEGAAGHAQPARRQGREPRRDGESRPAGAARLHHHHRGLHLLLRQREEPIRPSSTTQVDAALAQVGKLDRQDVRRRQRPAAGLGALGRPRLDARHDGHGPQPRPQRRHGRGAGEDVGRSPLRLRQLSPLHHDVFRRRARRRPRPLRGDPRRATRSRRATCSTPTSTPTTGTGSSSALQGAREGARSASAFPQDPHEQLWGAIGAVFSLLDERARQHLSAAAQHPGELGHRRQRAGDGVRQHGRHLGHRRRLHPQSLDRREAALRRVPDQRAGRGRRRRHPHAAGDHRGARASPRHPTSRRWKRRCRRRSPS